MELWFRSQDRKELQRVNIKKLIIDDNLYPYWVIRNNIEFTGEILGKYRTEKRAIEVLDQIQEHIVHIKDEKLGNIYYPVFQMPKE